MEDTPDIDKILLKMHYKAKREAIKQLKKEYKNNSDISKKLEKLEKELPANY